MAPPDCTLLFGKKTVVPVPNRLHLGRHNVHISAEDQPSATGQGKRRLLERRAVKPFKKAIKYIRVQNFTISCQWRTLKRKANAIWKNKTKLVSSFLGSRKNFESLSSRNWKLRYRRSRTSTQRLPKTRTNKPPSSPVSRFRIHYVRIRHRNRKWPHTIR